jgi:hypothetical protein
MSDHLTQEQIDHMDKMRLWEAEIRAEAIADFEAKMDERVELLQKRLDEVSPKALVIERVLEYIRSGSRPVYGSTDSASETYKSINAKLTASELEPFKFGFKGEWCAQTQQVVLDEMISAIQRGDHFLRLASHMEESVMLKDQWEEMMAAMRLRESMKNG